MSKNFGCTRFVYNYYLDVRIKKYENNKESFGYYACCKDLTKLKEKYKWLKDADSHSLQCSLKDLNNAYKNYFKNGAGFPKFKSKKSHKKTYRTNNVRGTIGYFDKYIKLPKLGMVKTRNNLVPSGRVLNATVTQESSGRYYVSLCCTDVEMEQSSKTGNVIGLDLGIKNFAVTSNGDIIKNPNYLKKSLEKLGKLQRELSRKSRDSSNYNKARIKLAKLYEHISNQRKDFLQKTSTEIINNNDVICIEDLCVKDMIRNNIFSRSISDVGWSEFVRQLQYKANWYNKTVQKVDRFFQSSQICNACQYINRDMKDLSIREWVCIKCGTHHDRDINAAINILNEGLRTLATP